MKIYYDQKVDAVSNPFNPESLEPFHLALEPFTLSLKMSLES
jgi:hypothetical protein